MAEHRNTLGTDYWRHTAASSIRNHKWMVTISVILASSSRHEPEYLFILNLVNVEMGFPNRGCRLRLQRHGQKWRLFIEFYKVVQLRNFIPRFLTVPHRKIYQTNMNI